MKYVNMVFYYLNFTNFLIELRVDLQSSADFTKRFDHHGPDFVFAVAEIWLQHDGVKHLLIPATRPGNFIEKLRDLRKLLSSPPSISGIEHLIPCGGWCSWMAGYWDRIDNECSTTVDEKIYDLLIPLSFVESKVGHIAIYMYDGKKIFEVATRSDEHEERRAIGVWSHFSSDALGAEVAYLEKAITRDIRGEIERQPQ